MIVNFKQYLHDDEFYEDDLRYLLRDAGVTDYVPDEVITAACDLNPFYEVTLDCTLNTVTGRIEIIGVATS